MSEVERLLHYALAPVEPPGTLTERLEQRLSTLTDAAVDEIAEFDPSGIRDPRRWARVVAAGVVAGGAGGALILVRARQTHKKRQASGLRALESAVVDVVRDVERRIGR